MVVGGDTRPATHKHCGTLPRTKGMQPCALRTLTRSPSSSLRPLAALQAMPHVVSYAWGTEREGQPRE